VPFRHIVNSKKENTNDSAKVASTCQLGAKLPEEPGGTDTQSVNDNGIFLGVRQRIGRGKKGFPSYVIEAGIGSEPGGGEGTVRNPGKAVGQGEISLHFEP